MVLALTMALSLAAAPAFAATPVAQSGVIAAPKASALQASAGTCDVTVHFNITGDTPDPNTNLWADLIGYDINTGDPTDITFYDLGFEPDNPRTLTISSADWRAVAFTNWMVYDANTWESLQGFTLNTVTSTPFDSKVDLTDGGAIDVYFNFAYNSSSTTNPTKGSVQLRHDDGTGDNFTAGNFSLKVGDSALIDSVVTVPDGLEVTNESWAIANTAVASLTASPDSGREVHGLKAGATKLTVTETFSDGSTATDTVTVTVTDGSGGGSGGSTKPASVKSGFVGSNTHTLGSNASLLHSTDKDFALFKSVQVDGKTITQGTDYTAKAGSTDITLLPGYLNSLSVGTHSLTVLFSDGTDYGSTFKIVAAAASINLPATGDSTSITTLVVALVTVLALALALALRGWTLKRSEQ